MYEALIAGGCFALGFWARSLFDWWERRTRQRVRHEVYGETYDGAWESGITLNNDSKE